MIIADPETLKKYHVNGGRCEGCGALGRTIPHHLWVRGRAGGTRLDVPWNLMRLLEAFDCDCHERAHSRSQYAKELRAKAAIREKCHVDDLEHARHIVVHRVPKDASDVAVEHALGEANADVRRLVWVAVKAYRRLHGEN